MIKIQKLISSCNECEHFENFNGVNSRTVKICSFDYDNDREHDYFLLDFCVGGSNEISIPDKCPLITFEINGKH